MKSGLGNKLDRWWRVFATGYCFVFFGLFAVILSVTLFPLLRLTSRNSETGRVRIQGAMSWAFGVFWGMMRFVGVIKYAPCDAASLGRLRQPGQLIVANHPTLIDVVLLVSLLPEVDCIVKDALWRNPFLRWPVLWAGYIPNRTAEELVGICAASLKAGRSLLVFPEGTRTVPGKPLNMRRGASQIALASLADIVPVTICCEPLMLAKTQGWYEAPQGPGHFKVHIGEVRTAAEYSPDSMPHSLAARAVTRWFEDYFTASLRALSDSSPPKIASIVTEAARDSVLFADQAATLAAASTVTASIIQGPQESRTPLNAGTISTSVSFPANDIHSHANS